MRHHLGVRVLYVKKKVTDRFGTRNVGRPRSAYNIPLTRRASGPSFAYATAVVPPRIARIGFRYTF